MLQLNAVDPLEMAGAEWPQKKANWHRKIGVWIFRLSWRLLWASQKPFAKGADQLTAWITDRVNWMQRAIVSSRIFSGSASDPQNSMHWTTILGEVFWMPKQGPHCWSMKRKAAGPIFDCSYEGSASEQKLNEQNTQILLPLLEPSNLGCICWRWFNLYNKQDRLSRTGYPGWREVLRAWLTEFAQSGAAASAKILIS